MDPKPSHAGPGKERKPSNAGPGEERKPSIASPGKERKPSNVGPGESTGNIPNTDQEGTDIISSNMDQMPTNTSRPGRNFKNFAKTQADEDAYDYVKYRTEANYTGTFGSIAHLVKGALGGGILSGHVAYLKSGIGLAIPLNVLFGLYMGYCLHLLVKSAQILYKRTRIPSMSYSDVGEASLMMCKFPWIANRSTIFRYMIDAIICLDLFGSCACYQIIIAKQIKQLVEGTHATSFDGSMTGYPGLRTYLTVMIPFIVLFCLIRHLKWLAPFSIVANFVIIFCIALAIIYAIDMNPEFKELVMFTSTYGAFEFIGMTVFSMSCAGVVIPIENNMKDPSKFTLALVIGMIFVVISTLLVSFFGYAAFLTKSESPITVNFPMSIWPNLLKGAIAMMIYVTHGLNFWVPFNLCFYYIKGKLNGENEIYWELIYRTIFVVMIGLVAIVFPDINAIMNFLGTFCLSNMAFIWPNMINLLVIWDRPGLGQLKWRLWRSLIFIGIGIFIFVCGGLVSIMGLISVFIKTNVAPAYGGGYSI